ncbi:aspartyl-phosphate phosphatase Spo0E family protein [Terrilactibacillus sp. S3-3]|nr:aspartyl-phosphate phosphatase Spo0E family protein [Terrilactibacillus sp. S3-3]
MSKKRKEMIEVASVWGITDGKTVKHSMELDVLINLYQQFMMKRKKVMSR